MAFSIPSLKDLSQRTRNAFRSHLPGADAWIWPNNIYVVAKVFAGIVHLIFLRLKWIDKQRFATTATGVDLIIHGTELGVNPRAASYAQGFVNLQVTYPYEVPGGTVFTRGDGVTFLSTTTVQAIQGAGVLTLPVPVICQTVGKTGNTIAGTPLSTNLSGLAFDPVGVVSDAGLGQGVDAENEEEYRERVLFRKRKPPMGGADHDYVAWAKEVPGVTRVYVKGNAFGAGTVGLWFLMDGVYPFGVPQPADVDAVQAHINIVKPTAARVFVRALTADCVDVIVKGISPDTEQVRRSVAAELLAVFTKLTQPGLPGQPFVLRHSWLEAAVSNATGENYNEGVIAPASDITFGPGVMPCIKSVTFVP